MNAFCKVLDLKARSQGFKPTLRQYRSLLHVLAEKNNTQTADKVFVTHGPVFLCGDHSYRVCQSPNVYTTGVYLNTKSPKNNRNTMAYSVSPVLAIVFKYCSKTGGISPFFFSKSVNKMNSVKMFKKLGSDNCLKLI